MEKKEETKRTIDVKQRMFCDTAAAIGAGFIVAPLITPVDVAVTAKQSGLFPNIFTAFLDQFKKMLLTPHKFFLDKPYLWIFSVYSSTYVANNTIDSLCKIYKVNDVVPKLVGCTAVNMFMSILKDAALARYFGTKPPGKVPTISYIYWLVRDVMSMAAAFIIPERIAKIIHTKKEIPLEKAQKTSQFLCPMGFQLFFLPIHLLGLDYYNIEKSTFGARFGRIAKTYFPAMPLRFFRMGSAYGVGGVNNKKLRNFIISRYEGKNWDKNY